MWSDASVSDDDANGRMATDVTPVDAGVMTVLDWVRPRKITAAIAPSRTTTSGRSQTADQPLASACHDSRVPQRRGWVRLPPCQSWPSRVGGVPRSPPAPRGLAGDTAG